MHDPRTPALPSGRRLDAAEHRVHEGPGLVPVRRMHDQARRFVHHHDVLVLVEHVDRDVLRPQQHIGLRWRNFDDELLPLTHLVRRLDRGAVDPDAPIAREALDRAPRQQTVVREELVDTLPTGVDAQGDGLAQSLACGQETRSGLIDSLLAAKPLVTRCSCFMPHARPSSAPPATAAG